jgi:hypothetical protein
LRAVCRTHNQVSGHGFVEVDEPADTQVSLLVEEVAHRREVERALREALLLLQQRESELQRSEEQTGRLLKVTGAIADAVTPEQVYEATVDHVAAGANASTAALWLVDGSHLRLVRAVGYSDATRRRFDAVDLRGSDSFPALDAVRRNTPIWIPSQAEMIRRYPQLATNVTPGRNYRVTCLPVVSEGRAVGAIGVTIEAEGEPSEPEREFLLLIARYASQAIERLRLLEAEQTSRARTEELYRFAQAVMGASQVDQVFDGRHERDPHGAGRRPGRRAAQRRAWRDAVPHVAESVGGVSTRGRRPFALAARGGRSQARARSGCPDG